MSVEPSSSASPGLAIHKLSFMERFFEETGWPRYRNVSLAMIVCDYTWYGWWPQSAYFGRSTGSLLTDLMCMVAILPILLIRLVYGGYGMVNKWR